MSWSKYQNNNFVKFGNNSEKIKIKEMKGV